MWYKSWKCQYFITKVINKNYYQCTYYNAGNYQVIYTDLNSVFDKLRWVLPFLDWMFISRVPRWSNLPLLYIAHFQLMLKTTYFVVQSLFLWYYSITIYDVIILFLLWIIGKPLSNKPTIRNNWRKSINFNVLFIWKTSLVIKTSINWLRVWIQFVKSIVYIEQRESSISQAFFHLKVSSFTTLLLLLFF